MKITKQKLIECGFKEIPKMLSYEKTSYEGFNISIYIKDKEWFYVDNQDNLVQLKNINDVLKAIYHEAFYEGQRKKVQELKTCLNI